MNPGILLFMQPIILRDRVPSTHMISQSGKCTAYGRMGEISASRKKKKKKQRKKERFKKKSIEAKLNNLAYVYQNADRSVSS